MPDWSSEAELAKDSAAFVKFMHVVLGVYLWEWALSLDFDWSFISGQRKFRWPLGFYFAGRYLLLGAMVGIVVSLDVTTELDCQSLYTFNQLAGNASAGLASINLSLRTIAVWGHNRFVTFGLIAVICGHWSLILQGVLLTAQWLPTPAGYSCIITKTNTKILAATFIYTMAFDLLVLILNIWKLARRPAGGNSNLAATSSLGRMIFADGIIFFVIAFISNLIATVFLVINLNSIMSIIFNVPAVVASTIVASRVVRRLTNYANRGPEVFHVSSHSGNIPTSHSRVVRNNKPGVHVQMETFVHAGEDPIHYDVDKRTMSDSETDLEAKAGMRGL